MKEKNKTIKYAMAAAAAVSMLLRAFYVYYTPTWMRQHDVIGFGADEGQAPYIEYFYQGHFLLDFDPRERWGFFQPPLHHMLAALWIHVQEFFGTGYDAACEHVQILTFSYSLVTLLFAYMIFRYFKLEGTPMLLAFAITAIHPGFILMSGSVNNDMLAIVLTVIAIYLGLKWNDDPSWGNTVALAFAIGLGMMTKLSAGLVAPAVALVFVVKWIRGGLDNFSSYLVKFIVFIAICAPLALWSPIRNLLKFGVPVNYTPEVGEEIYASIWARIFDIRCSTPFVARISNGASYDEFNMLLGMMKTSLFGDQNFAAAMSKAGHAGMGSLMMTISGWILLVSGTILAAICFYATVRVLLSGSYIKDGVTRAYMASIYAVSLIMYVNFMISASYYSSMDFRYVLYLIPLEALMLGVYFEKSSRTFRVASITTTFLFSVSTISTYLLLYLVS